MSLKKLEIFLVCPFQFPAIWASWKCNEAQNIECAPQAEPEILAKILSYAIYFNAQLLLLSEPFQRRTWGKSVISDTGLGTFICSK